MCLKFLLEFTLHSLYLLCRHFVVLIHSFMSTYAKVFVMWIYSEGICTYSSYVSSTMVICETVLPAGNEAN